MSEAGAPAATIVVPTRDSAATIERCLRSCLAQRPPLEVVVVDNSSRDETQAIAARLGCRVEVHGPERSAQRNLGARLARAPWLLFVDADMELSERVLEDCLASCDQAKAGAAIIREVIEGNGFFARCRALEKRIYEGDDDIEAARFIHRDLFFAAGGYDERLHAGEDWDLQIRISDSGARTVRTTEPIFHLEGQISLRAAYDKKRYYGRALTLFRQKHPQGRQLGVIRGAFVRNASLLLAHPILASGLGILKTSEVLGARRGMREALREESVH